MVKLVFQHHHHHHHQLQSVTTLPLFSRVLAVASVPGLDGGGWPPDPDVEESCVVTPSNATLDVLPDQYVTIVYLRWWRSLGDVNKRIRRRHKVLDLTPKTKDWSEIVCPDLCHLPWRL